MTGGNSFERGLSLELGKRMLCDTISDDETEIERDTIMFSGGDIREYKEAWKFFTSCL